VTEDRGKKIFFHKVFFLLAWVCDYCKKENHSNRLAHPQIVGVKCYFCGKENSVEHTGN
jgi:hypothetical protein